MLFNLSLLDARVKDVAIPSKYANEVSNLSILQTIFTFPLLLGRRFLSRIIFKDVVHDFSPIALFFFLGLLMLLWGVGFGAYAWIKSILTDKVSSTGTVMISVLPLILGFQLLLQAVVLDIQRSSK